MAGESLHLVLLFYRDMGAKIAGEKTLLLNMIIQAASTAGGYTNFDDLGINPNVIEWGRFSIKWYSMAYLVGIFGAYWGVRRMCRQPGAPMAERHTDDLLFYAMLGVIAGGRIGYVLFYRPEFYFATPLEAFKLWDGGMSFHGGLIGVVLAMWWVARRSEPKLSFLRVADYIACMVPLGMLLGRLANFINGELWGRVTDVPWAMIFPASNTLDPRHPSQLYQAGLEGLLLLIVMTYAFWRTNARYYPGLLAGLFTAGIGIARFIAEFFREPDSQLVWVVERTGLSMGQWLSIPWIAAGLWVMWTARGRRTRIEPIAGSASVA
jgi:phosphatidylglycerol---prolipoprotein diacylglyceryl transferase